MAECEAYDWSGVLTKRVIGQVYMDFCSDGGSDSSIPFESSRMSRIVDRYQHTINLLISIPSQHDVDRFRKREQLRQKMRSNQRLPGILLAVASANWIACL